MKGSSFWSTVDGQQNGQRVSFYSAVVLDFWPWMVKCLMPLLLYMQKFLSVLISNQNAKPLVWGTELRKRTSCGQHSFVWGTDFFKSGWAVPLQNTGRSSPDCLLHHAKEISVCGTQDIKWEGNNLLFNMQNILVCESCMLFEVVRTRYSHCFTTTSMRTGSETAETPSFFCTLRTSKGQHWDFSSKHMACWNEMHLISICGPWEIPCGHSLDRCPLAPAFHGEAKYVLQNEPGDFFSFTILSSQHLSFVLGREHIDQDCSQMWPFQGQMTTTTIYVLKSTYFVHASAYQNLLKTIHMHHSLKTRWR